MRSRQIVAAMTLSLLLPAVARGEWPSDGRRISERAVANAIPAIVAGERGAAYLTWPSDWFDGVSGHSGIYVQCVDNHGLLRWPTPVALTDTPSNGGTFLGAAPDGQGGEFALYRFGSPTAYHISRVLSAGQIAPGWPVSFSQDVGSAIGLCSDGVDGVIVVRHKYISGTGNFSVSAVRFDGAGASIWTREVFQTSDASVLVGQGFDFCADGVGGLYVVWPDIDDSGFQRLWARHVVGSTGELDSNWSSGVLVDPTQRDRTSPRVTTSTDGSLYVAYLLNVNALYATTVRLQHISTAGTIASGWPENGILLANGNSFEVHKVMSDYHDGAVVLWYDGFSPLYGSAPHLQRVSSAAAPLWGEAGIVINFFSRDAVAVHTDGSVSVVGTSAVDGKELTAQQILPLGTLRCAPIPLGASLSSAANTRSSFGAVADGNGGVIAGWLDYRFNAETFPNLYAGWLSGSLDGNTTPCQTPVVLSDFHVVAEGSQALLTWAMNSTSAATYRIQRAQGAEGPFTDVSSEMTVPLGPVQQSYRDPDVLPPGTYYYRIACQDADKWSFTTVLSLRVSEQALLLAIAENPATGQAAFDAFLPGTGTSGVVTIFSIDGRLVRKIPVTSTTTRQPILWDGCDGDGSKVRSGVYLVCLESQQRSVSKRLVYLR